MFIRYFFHLSSLLKGKIKIHGLSFILSLPFTKTVKDFRAVPLKSNQILGTYILV